MTGLLGRYESLLIDNASTINTVESSIRSLTWLLPGRFKDAELASEALSALVNLISLYHDSLLARRLRQSSHLKSKPIIPPSVHTRYTGAWAAKASPYKWAATLLQVVRFVELLLEMGLRRRIGKRGAWRAIVTLESIKACLRLVILRVTRRPVLSPPIPERDVDPATLESDLAQVPSKPTQPSTPAHVINNRTNPATSARPPSPLLSEIQSPGPGKSDSHSQAAIEQYLLPKALSTADVRPSLALMRPLSTPREWLSEVVFVLRPLIYVIALARTYDRDPARRSSLPLLLSLSLEVVSYHLRRQPAAGLASTSLERQEYARRDRDLLWYFLRGDIWQGWTRPKLQSIASSGLNSRIPLVRPVMTLAGAFIQDWIPLIDEYYYYTAT